LEDTVTIIDETLSTVGTLTAFDELDLRLQGSLHTPDDPAYAELVTPWNFSHQMQPSAVVAARTAEDVAQTVRFAAEQGWTVGVQATGHGAVASLAGHVLVSTRGLDEIAIHPEGWARVGAGVKWKPVIEAAARYGLAPLNGSSSDVGVVGYTTGGGVGPMTRTFGLAADKVRAFDVVTGDGILRRASATENPDVFFALRGGKGAAGIVTAVEFDLIPMTTFYGGALYFDGADVARVVESWRTWSQTLPEQATTSFALLRLPAMPDVPPPLAGKLTLSLRFAWTGEPEEGERLLAPMRAVAAVLIDDVAHKPYTAVDSVHQDPVDPMPVTEGTTLLASFPAEAADALLAQAGADAQTSLVIVEVRQLGGAYARAGEPTAFDHRGAAFSVLTVGIAMDPTTGPSTERVLGSLEPWSTGGVWPNFASPHDADSARRAYTPATLARIAEIRRRYDPRGVLQAAAYVGS
jgi:FAD/FMN-containing dehydrogenase